MKLIDERTQALIQAGLVKAIDAVFLAILILDSVTAFYSWCFGHLTETTVLTCLLIGVLVSSFWAVMLGYRACVMVLQARADINMMPVAAAKLANSFRATPPPATSR